MCNSNINTATDFKLLFLLKFFLFLFCLFCFRLEQVYKSQVQCLLDRWLSPSHWIQCSCWTDHQCGHLYNSRGFVSLLILSMQMFNAKIFPRVDVRANSLQGQTVQCSDKSTGLSWQVKYVTTLPLNKAMACYYWLAGVWLRPGTPNTGRSGAVSVWKVLNPMSITQHML